MKRLTLAILCMSIILTFQIPPVFAGSLSAYETLTDEDQSRLMKYKIPAGPYSVTNEELRNKTGNYHLYVYAAKDYMELQENYNYREISTEAGRKKYLEGYAKYNPFDAGYLRGIENEQLSYITRNKLIKEAAFVTNDNCVFADGSGAIIVRGVMYLKIHEMKGETLESFKNVKAGIVYKADMEVYPTGRPDFTDASQILIDGFRYLSKPVAVEQAVPEYSALPASSKVMVNGNAISFEAYNIDGSNYFKLRDLAMAVNGTEKQFEVGWDGSANAIDLKTNKAYTPVGGELSISAKPAAREAKPTTSKVYVNGREVSFSAYIIGGSNYFKLRDIARAVDFGVTWDGKTNIIGIDTSLAYTEE